MFFLRENELQDPGMVNHVNRLRENKRDIEGLLAAPFYPTTAEEKKRYDELKETSRKTLKKLTFEIENYDHKTLPLSP